MIPGMSRFNPMSQGNAGGKQPPPAQPQKAPPVPEQEKDKPLSSMSSIASMATMGKSMTQKLGAGLHTVAHLPNPLGGAKDPTSVDADKKTKQAAAEKKAQISQVMTILEDVHLQCPQSHTGIIVAYAGANCSPILNPGIKFTWFRMSGEDKIDQVDDTSSKPWYAPTVDDIGTVICAQCEDTFYQGCSRYTECGPIKADALLCSLADTAVENGSFETTGIFVSLGLKQAPLEIHQVGSDMYADVGRESFSGASMHEHLPPADGSGANALPTVLSKKVAFLQFDGRSTVEVDEHGIFISIPTMDNTATTLVPAGSTAQKPAGMPGRNRDIYPSSGKESKANVAAAAAARTKFKTARRGLRIPTSAGLKVNCAQPLSLVLSVPLKRSSDEDGSDSPYNNNTGTGLDQESEEERMRRFLSSSTVSIPWTYEGHNHSPEAYIKSDPNLTYEDKQEILREAERDSVIFANTVVALAEFISALPEGTSEICFCFACPDRLVRDTMVVSMRSLTAKGPNATRYERRAVFPWVQSEGTEALVAEATENETLETKKILKAKEEENMVLKRERNELTVQLLESREELVGLKSKMQQLQTQAAKTMQTPDKRNSMPGNGAKKGTDEPFAGFATPAEAPPASASDIGKAEAFKQLSSKIIELENKVSIASKREAEAAKARTDIEARNTTLNTDLARATKLGEDLTRKVASLQSLNDAKTQSIQLLEKDQEHNKGVILSQEIRLRELEVLRVKLEKTEASLAEVKQTLEAANEDNAQFRALTAEQSGQIEELRAHIANQAQQAAEDIAKLQIELAASQELNARYEAEIELHKLVIAECARLKDELEEAQREKDRLSGEINHLKQKSESQARDLQKHIKDSAAALTEFEKALVRKSEECNELYVRVNLWEKAEEDRLAAEQNTVTHRMMKRIGSIHIPEGLALPIPGTGAATGKTSGRSSPTSDDDSRGAKRAGHRLPPTGGSGNAPSGATAKPAVGGLGALGGVLRTSLGKTPTKN